MPAWIVDAPLLSTSLAEKLHTVGDVRHGTVCGGRGLYKDSDGAINSHCLPLIEIVPPLTAITAAQQRRHWLAASWCPETPVKPKMKSMTSLWLLTSSSGGANPTLKGQQH